MINLSCVKNYNHLNQSQRYALKAYLSVNKSRSEISSLLIKVSESTVTRALKRNCVDLNKVYRAYSGTIEVGA